MEFGRDVLNTPELIAEQAEVQAGMQRARSLEWYGEEIFLASEKTQVHRSPVTEFLGQFANRDNVRLDLMLQGMYEDFEEPIHWADMGDGYGMALRQAAAKPELAGKLQTTGIDLFDLNIADLSRKEKLFFRLSSPACMSKGYAPRQLQANVETVQLPEPAHFISAIELVQYLDNPLACIVNWYNQLTDHGILAIATENPWTGSIYYKDKPGHRLMKSNLPIPRVIQELSLHAIDFAFADQSDDYLGNRPQADAWDASSLVIQKAPGTRLELDTEVVSVGMPAPGFGFFKSVRYKAPETSDSPIRVVRQ